MLDKILKEERERYIELKSPDNMEEILMDGLNNIPEKRNNRRILKVSSIFLIFTIIIGLNSNTIAYNIKNLKLGTEIVNSYNELVSNRIKDIENSNYMQKIDKEIVFNNGNKIIVDGILRDKLGTIILYREYGDDENSASLSIISGGEYYARGHGMSSEIIDNKYRKNMRYIIGELKDLNINLEFNYNNEIVNMEIKFDKDLFIDDIKELKINKNVDYDNNTYKIKGIKATPLNLTIEGSNENIFKYGIRRLFNIKEEPKEININLLLDGKAYKPSSWGSSTGLDGNNFSFRFDDFPKDIDNMSLEIVNESGELIEIIELKN